MEGLNLRFFTPSSFPKNYSFSSIVLSRILPQMPPASSFLMSRRMASAYLAHTS